MRLHIERQRTDLVEEKCAAVSEFDFSLQAAAPRAAERTFNLAE
jgi:hypothetical protein